MDETVRDVRPAGSTLSHAGRSVAILAVPWAIGFLLVADAVLSSLGSPGPERPIVVRFAIVAIAAGPLVAWWTAAGGWLGRVPGFRRLLAWPQPLARLSPDAIELTLPGEGTRRFDWEGVAALVPDHRWRDLGSAELHSPDGALLAVIPAGLAFPKAGWRSAPTLADLVVATRPDRYAITGGDAWGRSDAFDLVDRVPAPIDLATLRHRRVVLLGAIMVLLAILAVVGTFLLLSKPV